MRQAKGAEPLGSERHRPRTGLLRQKTNGPGDWADVALQVAVIPSTTT